MQHLICKSKIIELLWLYFQITAAGFSKSGCTNCVVDALKSRQTSGYLVNPIKKYLTDRGQN